MTKKENVRSVPTRARLTGLVAKLNFAIETTADGQVKVRLDVPVEARYETRQEAEHAA